MHKNTTERGLFELYQSDPDDALITYCLAVRRIPIGADF